MGDTRLKQPQQALVKLHHHARPGTCVDDQAFWSFADSVGRRRRHSDGTATMPSVPIGVADECAENSW